MSGQAQDSVVLHVPARNNDVAAAGGNFCSNGFVAELGQNRWKDSMSSGMIFTSV